MIAKQGTPIGAIAIEAGRASPYNVPQRECTYTTSTR